MSCHQSFEKGWCVKETNKRRLKSMKNRQLEHSFKCIASWLYMDPMNFPSTCIHLYKLMKIIRWYSQETLKWLCNCRDFYRSNKKLEIRMKFLRKPMCLYGYFYERNENQTFTTLKFINFVLS